MEAEFYESFKSNFNLACIWLLKKFYESLHFKG